MDPLTWYFDRVDKARKKRESSKSGQYRYQVDGDPNLWIATNARHNPVQPDPAKPGPTEPCDLPGSA